MEKKMTYVEAITIAMENADLSPEVTARLNDLINSLTKKTVSKAQQEKARENADLKERIHQYLDLTGEWESIASLLTNCPALNGLSAQRVSRLLTDLKDAGLIDRKLEKGKVYFRITE